MSDLDVGCVSGTGVLDGYGDCGVLELADGVGGWGFCDGERGVDCRSRRSEGDCGFE